MDYGWGAVTWEIHQFFSVEGKLLLGASEQGFAAGVGGIARIGQIGGTNFEVGGQLVQHIGNQGFFRFSWDTVPRVPMALTIDLTQRPDGAGNPLSRRMFPDLEFELNDHLTLTGQIGVASRDGDLMGGGRVTYAS